MSAHSRWWWPILLWWAAVPAGAAEPPAAPEDLAAILEPIRAKHGLPALGGAIVAGRNLVGLGATGVRRAGFVEPVTTGDLWHLGSCTKAMTATLIARLVKRGRISFDLDLAGAFPDLRENMREEWRSVTLAQLLAHRGGAPADLRRDGLWSRLWKREGSPREQRMQLVWAVLGWEPISAPNTAFLYSNAGYAVAGAAAEVRMDRPFEELLREEVFRPLGMTSPGSGAPGTAAKLDQPWGHRFAEGRAVPVRPGPGADNPPAIGPAGTVHATLADWARFVAVHLAGARGEETGFLEPETFRRLHTPLGGGTYALGWGTAKREWAGGRVLTHSGSNTMWHCVTWLAPERDFAVLVTANRGGAAKPIDEAAWALIRHHQKR